MGPSPWLERFRRPDYGRPPRLILLNGLAEQAESWYRNHRYWRRYFDVHAPNILAYEGDALHRRIDAGLPISVDYLVNQLHHYLDEFVQAPPYHLVASSLGGKVAVEFAARFPELVGRLVLLCPSGLGDAERLPIVEGVRRNDPAGVIRSVFANPRFVNPVMVEYYRRVFARRRWKVAVLRTVRGTNDHNVRARLAELIVPTLLVGGADDRIVDPRHAAEVAGELPHGRFVMIPKCGHAPQIEKAWFVNRLVVHFLTNARPTRQPSWAQLLLV